MKDIINWLHNSTEEEIEEEIKLLEDNISILEDEMKESFDNGDSETFDKLVLELELYEKDYRMIRGYVDILFFAYEYLNDRDYENGVIPGDLSIHDAPKFHVELTDKLNELTLKERTKSIAWAAPRGSAKSTYLSNVTPIHSIVYQTRKYILIISETATQSANFINYVRDTLKENEKLREDFGIVLSKNQRENKQDNSEGFITLTNIKLEGSSTGKQLRGRKFLNSRPDLIIMDDLESKDNTNTEKLRQDNINWYDTVIEPLGDPNKTAIIYMGTLVHAEGLLPNILDNPNYDSAIYSSIVKDSDRIDLWEKYIEIYRDKQNRNRKEEAELFYEQNKDEMNRGTEVLWPERLSYHKLMMKKATMIPKAFYSEYLNIPYGEENSFFDSERVTFYEEDIVPNNLNKVLHWDPAITGKGDYNAIAVVGKDEDGVIYVLDTWQQKCKPHVAMEQLFLMAEKHRTQVISIESIAAQELLFDQTKKNALERGIFFAKFIKDKPQSNKNARIEELEPLFENDVLRLNKKQNQLIEELEQYPNATHDDLVDALASAVRISSKIKRRRTYRNKPIGL